MHHLQLNEQHLHVGSYAAPTYRVPYLSVLGNSEWGAAARSTCTHTHPYPVLCVLTTIPDDVWTTMKGIKFQIFPALPPLTDVGAIKDLAFRTIYPDPPLSLCARLCGQEGAKG